MNMATTEQETSTEEQESLLSQAEETLTEAKKQVKTFLEPRRWVYFVLAGLVVLLLYLGVSTWLLGGKYAKIEQEVVVLEAQRDALNKELDTKTLELISLKVANDAKVKEVSNSAFKKTYSTPDSGMLTVVNDLIDRSRKSNAEREQNISDN